MRRLVTAPGQDMIDHASYFPLVAFTLGSLTGMADLLRSGRRLGGRVLLASLLWHGLLSMGAALLLSGQIDSYYLLYGISIASAAGAFSLADIVTAGIRAKLLPPK